MLFNYCQTRLLRTGGAAKVFTISSIHYIPTESVMNSVFNVVDNIVD